MLQRGVVSKELMELLERISEREEFNYFMLGGGTALALHLGHRRSDDLDFFTSNDFDKFKIMNFFEKNYRGNHRIYHVEDDVVQIFANDIKIDWVKIGGKTLEEPIREGRIKIYGKRDIAAMKMLAICHRKAAKDYIDIGYLLKEYSIKDMLGFYKEKYGVTDCMEVKKALVGSERVNPYEWEKIKMIKNEVYISDIKKILREAVMEYNEGEGIGKERGLILFKKKGKGMKR